jgi:orotate phosphoribosyltransferase
MVAEELDAEFLFAEQFHRPSSDGLFPVAYRIPDPLRSSAKNKTIAVVDDVINAGSAVRGALVDLRACEAMPVAMGALLVLGTSAQELAATEGLALVPLASLPNTLWPPSSCPLCAAGIPLEARPDAVP